ncbi:hypothetical protein CHUAL_008352 [Chamberlinius hualienensis]
MIFRYLESFIINTVMWLTNNLLLGNTLTVEFPCGTINGYSGVSREGKPFVGYLAIPYAEPPIGDLRFKPPQPYCGWDGIRDGTNLGAVCPQMNRSEFIGDEDCLVLNIYVNQNERQASNLPVMVFIHGGSFIIGSGRKDYYGPEFIMDYPVVLVTINYRLGALGFYSTNDSSAYGNYGMMDQLLALEWVQKYIKHFNGNSSDVTVFGQSAGAASINFHQLSPLSEGLFNKAILESGTALNPWAYNPNVIQLSQQFASQLECSKDTTADTVDCLRSIGVEQLLSINVNVNNGWSPVIDAPGGPGFLTDNPETLLKSGQILSQVPTIIGRTALEDCQLFHYQVFQYTGYEYFKKQFPIELKAVFPVDPSMTEVFDAIEDQYYKDKNLNNTDEFYFVVCEILSDLGFNIPFSAVAYVMSMLGMPTFGYIYTYVGVNRFGTCGAIGNNYSTHEEELTLLFPSTRYLKLDERDTTMSKMMVSDWVQFAINPVETFQTSTNWPAYEIDNFQHLKIDLPEPMAQNGPISTKQSFWLVEIPALIQKYAVAN